MSGEDTYKLIYFNIMGRAEPMRLLFAYKGVHYEDFRFERADWPSIKPTTPFGVVPILEVNGKPLSQSTAIGRYLGRKYGMAGQNDWEGALCDQLTDAANDVMANLRPIHMETDPEKKKKLQIEFNEVTIPSFLARYDKFLADNGTGYFVGNSLTWADLMLFTIFSACNEKEGGKLLEPHTHLTKFVGHVANIDNIKKWIETRPKTAFSYLF